MALILSKKDFLQVSSLEHDNTTCFSSSTSTLHNWHILSCSVLGDFKFKDIDWPNRLSKSGSKLSQSEGQILIDIMNDHGLELMAHFPTREKNTLDLILTTLPGKFKDVHSPDKLSDHDIVSGTLKIFIPTIKNLGERCISIRNVIMNLWEKTHLSLQRKNTSMVDRILVQYKRHLIC